MTSSKRANETNEQFHARTGEYDGSDHSEAARAWREQRDAPEPQALKQRTNESDGEFAERKRKTEQPSNTTNAGNAEHQAALEAQRLAQQFPHTAGAPAQGAYAVTGDDKSGYRACLPQTFKTAAEAQAAVGTQAGVRAAKVDPTIVRQTAAAGWSGPKADSWMNEAGEWRKSRQVELEAAFNSGWDACVTAYGLTDAQKKQPATMPVVAPR